MAKKLWDKVGHPNTLIKIPATVEGLPAIAATIAEGISVNVTLIFSLDRYRGVMDAYLTASSRPTPTAGISRRSTPSRRSSSAGSTPRSTSASPRTARCVARPPSPTRDSPTRRTRRSSAPTGSRRSRPRAPTPSVRCGPRPASRIRAYSDTMYVTELVVANTVNTMPEKTLQAFADHGEMHGDGSRHVRRVARRDRRARGEGISYDDVVEGAGGRGTARSSTPRGLSSSRRCPPSSTRPDTWSSSILHRAHVGSDEYVRIGARRAGAIDNGRRRASPRRIRPSGVRTPSPRHRSG